MAALYYQMATLSTVGYGDMLRMNLKKYMELLGL